MLIGTITLRFLPSSPATFPHFKPPAADGRGRVARYLGPLGAAPAARFQNTTVPTFTAARTFIPKCHWSPFLVWRISGSRSPVAFLMELGASTMEASTARSHPPCLVHRSINGNLTVN